MPVGTFEFYPLYDLARDLSIATGVFITSSDILNRMTLEEILGELVKRYGPWEQLELF